MSDVVLVYSTFADKDEAISTARALLDARLIACANITGGVTSLYRWEGEIVQEPEALLLAKTTRAQLAAAIAKIKALHSYALPCIVAYEAQAGFAPFMQWVSDETTGVAL